MRSIIFGAMLALSATTAGAAEIDINSANFWLPYCRGYVATTTNGGLNGRLNADHGACMGRGPCNEGEATGHRVRSWFTMLRWSLSIGIINY
jgi:hypothetical protein